MHRILTGLTLALGFLASAAHAEEAPEVASVPRVGVRVHEPEYRHRLDIGGTFGFNNPGGLGLTADLRLFLGASLGLSAGQSMWGPKFSAHGRIYPAGISRGFFLEGGVGVHVGGDRYSCSDDRSDRALAGTCSDELNQHVELKPTEVAHAALGYRFDLAGRGWIVTQLGWTRRLNDPTFEVKRGVLSEEDRRVLDFARPGGLLIGVSGGFSVL